MSSKITRLQPASDPAYTMHVWHRSDGKSSAALVGAEGWEPDYLEIADDLIAFANGFIELSGYESKWWHEPLEQKWYIAAGIALGATTVGVLCALLSG